MSAPERPRDGLAACHRVEVPVARRSVSAELIEMEFDMQCNPERLRAAHPCALSRSTAHPVHKGFTGSWVFLLRHAARPSLARSGAGVLPAHGLRRNTQPPVNCASLEEANSTGCLFSPLLNLSDFLLVSQGVDWVQVCGLGCWHYAEDDSHAGAETEAE